MPVALHQLNQPDHHMFALGWVHARPGAVLKHLSRLGHRMIDIGPVAGRDLSNRSAGCWVLCSEGLARGGAQELAVDKGVGRRCQAVGDGLEFIPGQQGGHAQPL